MFHPLILPGSRAPACLGGSHRQLLSLISWKEEGLELSRCPLKCPPPPAARVGDAFGSYVAVLGCERSRGLLVTRKLRMADR